MSTPYDVGANDCYKVAVLKTLRGLLATDALTVGQFQGNIRKFPITTVLETDANSNLLPPGVALYAPANWTIKRATMGPSGVGNIEIAYGCCLEVALHERQKGADADYLDNLSETLQNYCDAFERVLVRNPVGPQIVVQGVRRALWHQMVFRTPATVEYRNMGQMMYSHTYFSLLCQRRIA